MILGIHQGGKSGRQLADELQAALAALHGGDLPQGVSLWADQGVALGWEPDMLQAGEESPWPAVVADGRMALAFQGRIFNMGQLLDELGQATPGRLPSPGITLLSLFQERREGFLKGANGAFSLALWDGPDRSLWLGRDQLGIEPLFYAQRRERLVFCSSLPALLKAGWMDREINPQALLTYLLFCYNPGRETLVRGIFKLPAGHLLRAKGEQVALQPYWRLSFAQQHDKEEREYATEVVALIRDAIRLRAEPDRPPGVFLSGGTDSSALVSLTSQLYREPLHTFSFRCRGKTYDESEYARLVAQRYGAQHTEISFDAAQARLISEAVALMDEPFCDVGIEIGTYLLGRAARGQISYVFSGEGGDEAFGGHPVYVADKVALLADRLGFLLSPLWWALRALPDSDQKKNWSVKAKRFAQSLSFPRELLSHRWRTYYHLEGLRELCRQEVLESCDDAQLFAGVLRHSRQADGTDLLSRSLYSDYHTLVDFYLRRLQMLKAFAVESRLPLLDHRLVEYAASMPSRLKVHGFGQTKYLYRQALEGIVPDQILHGRPKLGHSVPLKNWLREDQGVGEFVREYLTGETFRHRGLFHQETVQRMWREHCAKRDNHSHRLWALLVLELWLRTFLDR